MFKPQISHEFTEPKIQGSVEILGDSPRSHLEILQVKYRYGGTTEGDTIIQWEKADSSKPSNFIKIVGATKGTFTPTLDDVDFTIRVTVIPGFFSIFIA
jgi:hypothetical protein